MYFFSSCKGSFFRVFHIILVFGHPLAIGRYLILIMHLSFLIIIFRFVCIFHGTLQIFILFQFYLFSGSRWPLLVTNLKISFQISTIWKTPYKGGEWKPCVNRSSEGIIKSVLRYNIIDVPSSNSLRF